MNDEANLQEQIERLIGLQGRLMLQLIERGALTLDDARDLLDGLQPPLPDQPAGMDRMWQAIWRVLHLP